jgi:hypothetical protein
MSVLTFDGMRKFIAPSLAESGLSKETFFGQAFGFVARNRGHKDSYVDILIVPTINALVNP